ncbi:MAG: Apolipoprotein N-acyltransferase [Rhizobium sp.]|nr:Apolipoprotein N-acyltransferase [Rhizobium sp.]
MQRLAAYVMLSSGLKRFTIAILAGAFSTLAQPPFGIFIVNFISFPILLWLIDGAAGDPDRGFIARRLPSFMVGWAFGLGYFVAGLWWTGNALLVEADEFAWALPLAILGLPAYLALFYGLATLLARLVWTDGFARLLALAAAFGLAEWLRAFVLTGFPWNSVGYSMMPFPLMMQSVAVTGTYAMNILAVLVFAAPALIVTGPGRWPSTVLALGLLALHFGFGAYRLSAADAIVVKDPRMIRIVQPMIDQAAKIDDGERGRIFEEHIRLTTAPPKDGTKRPDYVIWPETSVPFILTQNPDALVRMADALDDGQILIAGAVRTESDGKASPTRYYNSAYMIDSQGQIIAATDKVHLVPFGEYLPFESFWNSIGLNAIAAFPGGYSAAPRHQILTAPDGTRLLPLICYEVIFPDEGADEAKDADAIVNLTNDGWFGHTPGPWQHFHQARIRAVESGLPVIRNSNSGISAIIDGYGRVQAGLDFGTVGFIDSTLPPKTVPIWHNLSPLLNFGLLEGLLILLVFFSRMSFIFSRN